MATRDQLISDALKEVKESLLKLGDKLDLRMVQYSKDLSDLKDKTSKDLSDFKEKTNKDLTDFKEKYASEMATLATQTKIYAAIASFIGMAIGGVLVKFIVH